MYEPHIDLPIGGSCNFIDVPPNFVAIKTFNGHPLGHAPWSGHFSKCLSCARSKFGSTSLARVLQPLVLASWTSPCGPCFSTSKTVILPFFRTRDLSLRIAENFPEKIYFYDISVTYMFINSKLNEKMHHFKPIQHIFGHFLCLKNNLFLISITTKFLKTEKESEFLCRIFSTLLDEVWRSNC